MGDAKGERESVLLHNVLKMKPTEILIVAYATLTQRPPQKADWWSAKLKPRGTKEDDQPSEGRVGLRRAGWVWRAALGYIGFDGV